MRSLLLLAAVLLLARPGAGQSWVEAVSPSPNAISADEDAVLTVRFSEAMDPASLTPDVFQLRGDRGGAYALASVEYDAASRTATLDPVASSFHVGETLTASVTTAVTNAGGQPMPAPFVWQFTIKVIGFTGTFMEGTAYSVGAVPYAIVASDFNRDGALDLATANRGAGTVSLLTGDGLGGFALAGTFAVGSQPEGLVAGDWNGDGAPDLATADAGSASVTVLLGDGAGQFTASSVGVGGGPHTVRAGDLNGDGHLDLVTSEFGTNALSVLLGDGLGGFVRTPLSGVGGAPELVMIRDFDGDGDLDLAAPSFGGGSVVRFVNDGSASFTASAPLSVGGSLHGPCAGDMTGDGRADVLAPSFADGQLYRLTNDGSTFAAAPAAPVSGAWFCRTGDLDGDGDLDAAVTQFNAAQVSVWLNDGTGTFESVDTVATGIRPHGLVLGDFDGNGGGLDLATANDGSASVTVSFNRFPVATEGDTPDARGMVLEPVYPNPSASGLTAAFVLAQPMRVRLALYDAQGRAVAVLLEGLRPAGRHEAALDTTGLAAGLYLLRLEAGGRTHTRRVTVAR